MSDAGPPASGSFPQAPPAPSLVGTVLDGRYRITKLIGEGGMGEVYAADHVHIEKKYAIKLLKPEIVSNAEAVTRFRQEARSSSSIGHRNIIAIEDFGQLQDGRIYMCMELLNGAALNDMITQPMPVDRLLNILIQTGHGLAAAHAKGIVHRDMKPENIFVTIDAQGQDVPKILDFGIAKVSGNDGQNHLTRTGTIFGTPFYMAPEQALGNPVDARTDIYAMGVIMYECFSGSLPFQGESFMGILTQHITTPPEPVAQRAAKTGRQLPIGLAEIIMRCMEKDPNARFRSMDELVNALIGVYRGIAGPGMSTYMEAFPILPSGQHPMSPTPPPMQPSGASAPTIGGPQGSPYPPPHPAPTPQHYGQSGGMGHAASGQSGLYDPSGSGLAVAPKKSKTGLIIGIIAVLAVGGGVAAFVVMNQKDDTKTAASNGSGSGSSATVDNPGSGSSQVIAAGSGSSAGSAQVPAAGSGSQAIAAGSGSSAVTPPPHDNAVPVVVMTQPYTAFEVFEGDKKLDDGPGAEVPVTPGTPRTIVIKAKGFKDKTVELDGQKKKLMVKLEAKPGANPHPPIVVKPPHPGGPDCSQSLVKPGDKGCQAQFCGTHPDAPACQIEQ